MVMPEKSKSGPPKFIPAAYLPFSSGFTEQQGAQEKKLNIRTRYLLLKHFFI